MKTITRVNDPIIFELNALAQKLRASGRKILSLGQAVPDLRPAPELAGRLKDIALKTDIYTYPPDAGLPELKRLIADLYLARDGAVYDPEKELIITAGANHAYMIALLTVTDPGDEVILLSPYYFNHGMAVDMLSRRSVEVAMDESGRWDIDVRALEKAVTPATKAITLVNPNNPTGAVFSREKVEEIAGLCRRHGIFLISDEVYDCYSFEGGHFRPASLYKDCVITIGSLSKALGFMGWRIGYLAAPEKIVNQALKAQDTSVICACCAGQLLAVEALKTSPYPGKQYLAGLVERKNILRDSLAGIPQLSWREPQGGLFTSVRLEGGLSPRETAFKLLEEKGVITVPLESFGKGGQNHLRLSFGCVPAPVIREASLLIRDYFHAVR